MGWKVKYKEKPGTQYPPMSERPEKVDYPLPGNKVTVFVHKIIGHCPAGIVEGDKLVFSPGLLLNECDCRAMSDVGTFGTQEPSICTVAVKSIYPPVVAMSYGVSAVDLGITKKGEDGYVICPAWGPPTCEAMVVFRLHPEPVEKNAVDTTYEYLAKMGYVSVPSYIFERFASDETKEKRRKLIEDWVKAGKPKFWDGWARWEKE